MEFKIKQWVILSLSVFLLFALLSQFLLGGWRISIVPSVLFTIVAYVLLQFNNNPLKIILLFFFFAIPLPFTLLTFLNIIKNPQNMFNGTEPIIITLTFIFLAMYSITYIFSLIITLKLKAFTLLSFLPIAHIALFMILFIIILLKHGNRLLG